MHITAYCPSCRSRYQLDPGLRGQRMRCPNPVCREVFEVQDAETDEAKPSGTGAEPATTPLEIEPSDGAQQQHFGESPAGTVRRTGSVGDLVPILDAEVVHEVPPPLPPSALPPTPIAVHKTIVNPDQDEDSKPIPVDDSFLPPPIEVENLVPLEPGEEERAKPIQEVTSWHAPPPIRNPQPPEDAPSQPAQQAEAPIERPPRSRKSQGSPKTLPAVPAKLPEEVSPAWHSAPPIRRHRSPPFSELAPSGAAPSMEVSGPQLFSPEPTYASAIEPSKTSRRALWIIGAMVVIAGFTIATVTVVTLNAYWKTEANLYAQARREYDEGKYGNAASAYQNLVKDFPNSEFRLVYQLLAELSKVRDQVYAAQADPGEALAIAGRFLGDYNNDPLLKSYRSDIWQTLGKLTEQLAKLAKQQHDPATLAKAKETLEQSKRYSDYVENSAARDLIASAEADILRWQKKQQLLTDFQQWLREPTVQAVKEARRLVHRESLEQDPDIKERITQVETAARLAVRYVPSGAEIAKTTSEAIEPSLLIVPPMLLPAKPSPQGKRAMFALARGVLYALDQSTGQELWATRVGIDTATLPVRLPATEASPELLLVLSADRNTIMALEPLTGRPAWQHRLSAPCLGKPVVVPRKAFVPTYDGRVYEIETARGYVLGHFELGPHLTVGGVWQEGTDLLYFPGESDYLYVLDAALANRPNQTKECVAILHTGHPSGSLRSEPILVNRIDPFAKADRGTNTTPGYLILTQTDGLEHMKLRVFGLPIDNPEAPPLLQSEPRVRGWLWFQPYHDGERLAFATDAGTIGLFGINQVRNVDNALFPELPQLPDEPKQKLASADAQVVRGQVVHVAESDFWVLANGSLQRLHFNLFAQQMVPVWDAALPLGSPVHAAQVDESEKTIFVVTQDLTQQIYLATAVAAEDGTIKWQRQLGLECQSDPLVLGREIVTVDRGGGLCIIDSSKYRHQEDREWCPADAIYAPALSGGPVAAHLLPGPDGTSVYEVACTASGGKLTVRRHQIGREPDKPIEQPPVELGSPLAGTPAIVGQSLLLPLANGTIRRFPLPFTGDRDQAGTPRRGEGGPNWRAARVDDDARGHIVAVAADEFLTTDGSRGLTHWRWPHNETFRTLPEDKVPPTVKLPARIISAPLVIPSANATAAWQVCVADSEGTLTLLQGPDLKPEQAWRLGGKITAGPFRRGPYVGCVVERRRLIWIDPSKVDPLWEYTMQAEGIVGEPQLAGDLVLVADLSGRFVGLDPASGKPQGPGYALKASAAPAAAPAAFGPDVAFIPLTDGTVFLLALRHLREPLAALTTLGP